MLVEKAGRYKFRAVGTGFVKHQKMCPYDRNTSEEKVKHLF